VWVTSLTTHERNNSAAKMTAEASQVPDSRAWTP
jgi:hypothetical protein